MEIYSGKNVPDLDEIRHFYFLDWIQLQQTILFATNMSSYASFSSSILGYFHADLSEKVNTNIGRNPSRLFEKLPPKSLWWSRTRIVNLLIVIQLLFTKVFYFLLYWFFIYFNLSMTRCLLLAWVKHEKYLNLGRLNPKIYHLKIPITVLNYEVS